MGHPSDFLDPDVYQELRTGCRGLAATVATLHQALVESGLPPNVADPIAINWFQSITPHEQSPLLVEVLRSLQNMAGAGGDEDEE